MANRVVRRIRMWAWVTMLLAAAISPLVLVAQNAGRGAIQTPGGGRGPGAAPDANDPANANADLSPKPPVVAMTPDEEAKRLWLPAGYRLTPILSEPIIEDPAQIAFDGNGRMFVVELRGYYQSPEGIDLVPPLGRISVHEDRDGDGTYERHSVFVDKLVFPRFVSAIWREQHFDDGDEHRRGVEVTPTPTTTALPTRRSCSPRTSGAPETWSHSSPACSGRWTTGCTAPSTRFVFDGRRQGC